MICCMTMKILTVTEKVMMMKSLIVSEEYQ